MSQVRPDNGALPGDVRCLIANGVGIDDEPIPIGASVSPRLAGSLPVLSLPLAEALFRRFVARDTRVVQDSLSRPEALPGGEGIDSPTSGWHTGRGDLPGRGPLGRGPATGTPWRAG